eukprot:scaffold201211_cov18-Prasinocladus_malaysianus.AAC.1
MKVCDPIVESKPFPKGKGIRPCVAFLPRFIARVYAYKKLDLCSIWYYAFVFEKRIRRTRQSCGMSNARLHAQAVNNNTNNLPPFDRIALK